MRIVVTRPREQAGELARALGFPTELEETAADLVVVGAGPAGLGAAVYAASEGLRTIVLDAGAVGGQAGSSSLIRNYLGFPRGLGGGELAQRAYQQAWLFGTRFQLTERVARLEPRDDGFAVGTADGFAVLRDPIACKPAVMAESDEWVAMASEYRAIATLPGAEEAELWEPEPGRVYVWQRAKVA